MKHLLTSTILIAFAIILLVLAGLSVHIYLVGGVVHVIDSGLELAYDLVIIVSAIALVTVAWLRLIKTEKEGR